MAAEISSPVLETVWDTETLDTGQIHDEVSRLWDQVGDTPAATASAPEDDVVALGPATMRASTINLIAVAGSDEHVDFIRDTVGKLRDFVPSRTVVIQILEERDTPPSYNVTVELREPTSQRTRAGIHFETITIRTDARQVGTLASLLRPLLMSELPTYLWWPRDVPHGRTLFSDLVDIVDRLTIDSSRLIHAPGDVERIRSIRTTIASELITGDFAWLRLSSWRQLLAQFFDPEHTQDCLTSISEVNIAYAAPRPDGASGLPAACLMAGWLSSRLGWTIVDPMETSKTGTSWTAMRATIGHRKRDIMLRMTPEPAPHALFSLRSVELIAVGEHPGSFRVERTDTDDLVTSSETPDMPHVSRMVYSKRPDSATMLASELQRLSSDRVYEEALESALKLFA